VDDAVPAAESGQVARVHSRRLVALVVLALASGALVLAGAAAVLPRHPAPLHAETVADVAHRSAAPAGRRGVLTAAQQRVLAEVPGARRSGTTVVVPVTPDPHDGGHGTVPPRELPGGVLALGVHAYTEPWDWRGVVSQSLAALRPPAPGAVVGDLGPAYLGCRVEARVGPGCVLTTLVRDRAGAWRYVDAWFVRWAGGESRPTQPDRSLQVRVYADLSGPVPQHLVVGAALGEPGTVRLRTVRGDVETADPDASRLAEGFWTFRVLLPDPAATVTTYDAQGRRSATWGVHETNS
jgi:hypothetical protein